MLVVKEIAEVTGRGLAVFFEDDAAPTLNADLLTVRIRRPDGSEMQTSATRQFARKVPPGEVIALLVPGANASDIPRGSTVEVVPNDAAA